MKKFTVLLILGAFLFSGALLNSCKKDEMRETTPAANLALKDVLYEDCALPLMMGQHTYIGCVNIYIDPNGVYVVVDLNEDLDGYVVTESHLYYGNVAPAMWQPGQFPYELDLEYMSWVHPELFDYCTPYLRFFALHLQLEKVVDDVVYEETAWLLPADGSGVPLTNNKGKPVGWGQYFSLLFQIYPEVSSLMLYSTTDLTAPITWTEVGMADENFALCYDESIQYYYLDATIGFPIPFDEDYMNPFFLTGVSDPEGFEAYWAARFIDGVNEPWEIIMQQIIDGDLPMFFFVFDGTDQMLVDGLLYALTGTSYPLRINGDYYQAVYDFTGTIMGDDGCVSEEFTVGLEVLECE